MALTESEKKAATRMLSEVPLFSSVKKKHLNDFIESSGTRTFEDRETIVEEGEEGVCFYLILEGQVEVRHGRRVLAKLGRGQFFGEMALLDKEKRSASVMATEKTTCLLVTRWSFKALLSSDPDIAISLLAELTRRLRKSNMALSE